LKGTNQFFSAAVRSKILLPKETTKSWPNAKGKYMVLQVSLV